MFKIIIIFLISLLIINNVNSLFNDNLYSVTPGNNNDINILVVTSLGQQSLFNKTYTLPINDLSVEGISSCNFTTGIITLFCLNNQKQFLIDLDINSGEFNILNSISIGNNNLNNGNSYQNYLYGYNSEQKQQVYLASNIEGKEGLSIVNWNFDKSLANQEVNIYSVLNTADIDTTITPFGALDFNNNIIVAYHSLKSEANVATILFLDLNGTLDDSSNSEGSNGVTNLLPFETHQIQIYLHDVSTINFLYTDYMGNVYIVSNGTSACRIDFTQQTCYSIYDIINNNDDNYPSFILSQDKQSIVSISNIQQQLDIGVWEFNFNAGMSFEINNYWKNTNNYSFFLI